MNAHGIYMFYGNTPKELSKITKFTNQSLTAKDVYYEEVLDIIETVVGDNAVYS